MNFSKRHITVGMLLVLLTCNSVVSAQANVWFGGGVNFSKMHKAYTEENIGKDDNLRTGYNLGLSFDQTIRKSINIESSIIYDTKGYVTKLEDVNNTTIRLKTHYLDLYPICFKYFITHDEKTRFYGKIGPYVGVGLFGKEVQRDDNGYYKEDIDWAAIELERFDFGINFGIGYEFNKALLCEVSYDQGIKNITENTNKFTQIRNNTIKVSVKVSLSHLFAPVMREDGKGFKKTKAQRTDSKSQNKWMAKS